MVESREVKSVEAMKEHSRRLHKQAQPFDNDVGGMHQATIAIIILSVLVLFCLGMWGCEAQEDISTDIPGPVNNGPEGVLSQPQFPRSPNSAEPLLKKNEFYPAQLAKRLQESGFHYQVINAGVSGETSAGGVRRVEWILKSQPTIVILELGVNDGLRGLPLQQTYANLLTIIERLKAEGVIVILAGMRIPVNYGEEYTGEFFEMYERLAQESGLPLIPFLLEGVAAQPDLNQPDGVHPTAEGYTLVTQNVWRTLEPILKKLSGER